MNSQLPDPEASLNRILREWRVEAQPAPRFNERVWRRIARAESAQPLPLWVRWGGWLNAIFTRPALAAGYLSLLLLSGVVAGYWHARHDNAQMSEQLSSRYVRLMDPYQMPRH